MAGVYRLPEFRIQRYWIPTAGGVVTTVPVTAGSVIWSGQTATANLTVPVTAGGVTWTGQTVTPTLVWPVSSGSVTWSGQTAAANLSVPVGAGSVTWSGQTVTVVQTSVSFIWSKGYELIHR